MPSLAEIRKKLQEIEERRSGNFTKKKSTSSVVYPFWNIQDGTTSSLRFLPDKDQDNTFFWVEKQIMKIPFPGVKGGDERKEVIVQAPCVEMWGDKCPVHDELRPWFKQNDKQLEALARVYWKKKTYILQGFVRKNALKEDETPENPIRIFQMSPQVYNLVKAILSDVSVETLPTDYEKGIDFNLAKTRKGGFADYTTSSYSRVFSALTQEERDAIDKYGLFNLADFLPKRPSAEELAVIYEMFQASIEGELYDAEKWGNFYKPRGLEVTQTQTTTSSQASVSSDDDAPWNDAPSVKTEAKQEAAKKEEPVATESTGTKSTQEILNMIRNRNK